MTQPTPPDGSVARVDATAWNQSELVARALDALATGEPGDGRFVDGRLVRVAASPAHANATDMVVGVSALPPGYSSPEHHHRAEELAIIVQGSGSIDIDGTRHAVEEGDIVLTPSDAPHVTTADEQGPLVVLWVYAPPGSESRWLAPEQENTGEEA